MTPDDLLGTARSVLDTPTTAPGGWPRMVALLTRQALEKALDEFWDSRPATAGLSGCTRRSQLACLPFYLNVRVAREASYVWAALSDACHYHAYELAPTASELARWLKVVAGLIESIHEATPGGESRTSTDSPGKGPG